MDLGELLAYKPTTSSKRIRDEDDDDEGVEEEGMPLRKVQKNGVHNEDKELTDEQKLLLLKNLDDDEEEVNEQIDAAAVKRMLLNFEKQVLRNQEMRIKFPDQPDKFMESELELNDEIQSLHIISTVPEHYPILVNTNIVQTLCGLLTHDNSDISIAVVDLLQELTDTDNEETLALIDALLEEKVIALLVQNLDRLDEKVKEDSDGVHNTLAIIENMCDLKGDEVTAKSGEQGLLKWLLKRVRVRQYDANKLYASEILAILLQGNEGNQRLLGDEDGIDILLQSLAYYKRRDPHSTDEVELMENLFDCLCSSLMYTPNRAKFLEGEGLQLMRLMLQSKKLARCSAIKVLNHAMCNAEGKDNCIKFIEIFGLGSLFPAYMKTPRGNKKTSGEEQEEHICSIMASLFRNISGTARDRLVSKFLENDHEKVDRLLELHFKYLSKVYEIDNIIKEEKKFQATIDSDDSELETYLRRLDAGLFTLQLIDYVIMELCLCGIVSIKGRVFTILSQRGESLVTVLEVLREFIDQITEDVKERDRLNELYVQLNDIV